MDMSISTNYTLFNFELDTNSFSQVIRTDPKKRLRSCPRWLSHTRSKSRGAVPNLTSEVEPVIIMPRTMLEYLIFKTEMTK